MKLNNKKDEDYLDKLLDSVMNEKDEDWLNNVSDDDNNDFDIDDNVNIDDLLSEIDDNNEMNSESANDEIIPNEDKKIEDSNHNLISEQSDNKIDNSNESLNIELQDEINDNDNQDKTDIHEESEYIETSQNQQEIQEDIQKNIQAEVQEDSKNIGEAIENTIENDSAAQTIENDNIKDDTADIDENMILDDADNDDMADIMNMLNSNTADDMEKEENDDSKEKIKEKKKKSKDKKVKENSIEKSASDIDENKESADLNFDIPEEIPNKKGKKTLFGKLFGKNKNTDTVKELIDTDDVLSETGSVMDDLEDMGLDEVSDLKISSANEESEDFDEDLLDSIDSIDDIEDKSKDKKKKEKKQKEKKPKKEKVKKEKRKKEKPRLTSNDFVFISPITIFLLLTIISVFVLGIYFGSGAYEYNNNIDDATSYYVNKDYTKAYNILAGMDLKSSDKEFYKQVLNIMKVKKYNNDFNTYIELKMYPDALQSLIKGIKSYDENIDESRELSTFDIQTATLQEINANLSKYFGMSESDARQIASIEDFNEYTNQINSKAANIIITEEGTDKK